MPEYMGKAAYKTNPFEGNFVGDNVEFTIGTEAANVIRVTVQLKSGPNTLWDPGFVQAYLSDNDDGSTLAGTAPSGGWAIGTEGLLIPLVTNKAAIFRSNDSGVFNVDITESGADTFYMVIILPSGESVVSDAITFAA